MKYSKVPFLLLCSVAAYFLSLSCGDLGLDNVSCLSQSDCGPDQVCLDDGFCGDQCKNDADCIDGEACLPELLSSGEIGNVCFPEDPVEEFCTKDTECVQKLGTPSAQCSIDNLCFIPQTLYSILIQDTSPDGEADGLAGADIGAVFLTNDDMIVAQGTTLIAKDADGNDVMSPIKGGPPSFSATKTCIGGDFNADTVHLGQKGYLLVRFLDTNFADYLEGPSTWNVNVIEWGENCGVVDDGDTYSVSLCTTSSYENIDFERECVQIGNGEDFSKFTTE